MVSEPEIPVPALPGGADPRELVDLCANEAEDCPDMQHYSKVRPGLLHEFVHRHGDSVDKATVAFECCKWTRIVAGYYDEDFEGMDPTLGPVAKKLHSTCTMMTSKENELHKANDEFVARLRVVSGILNTKRKAMREEVESLVGRGLLAKTEALEDLKKKEEALEAWGHAKLEACDVKRQEIKQAMDAYVADFCDVIYDLVTLSSIMASRDCSMDDLDAELDQALTALDLDPTPAPCEDLAQPVGEPASTNGAPLHGSVAVPAAAASQTLQDLGGLVMYMCTVTCIAAGLMGKFVCMYVCMYVRMYVIFVYTHS